MKLTKQYLKQKYITEKLSMNKIATMVGCSESTIRYYLKKYNILIRNHSDAVKGENNPFYNKHHSESTKKKISKIMKEKYVGKNHPFYGKHHSEKTKRKISKSLKGSNNPNWKGGMVKNGGGYIRIYSPHHPYKNNQGYVLEHRLVVEKTLGRYLKLTEEIHHINHIRDDNRIENLMVFNSKSAHIRYHKNPKLVRNKEIILDGRQIMNWKNKPKPKEEKLF